MREISNRALICNKLETGIFYCCVEFDLKQFIDEKLTKKSTQKDMGKCSVILLIGFYFTYLGRSVCNNEDSKVKTIKFYLFIFFQEFKHISKNMLKLGSCKTQSSEWRSLIFILVPSIQLQVNFVQNHSNQKCSVK